MLTVTNSNFSFRGSDSGSFDLTVTGASISTDVVLGKALMIKQNKEMQIRLNAVPSKF